jgi:hypothetical protein
MWTQSRSIGSGGSDGRCVTGAGIGGVGDRDFLLLGDRRGNGDGGRIHTVEAVTYEEMAMAAGSVLWRR